jgi:signal transduction histidine kinase
MLKFLANLRSRLIVLILLAVVPAFGLIVDSATRHRELTARQVKQSALVAARVIAAEQDRVLENAHQFLVTLARVPQIRDQDKRACRKILAALLEPRYADLVVADRAGNPLCTALPAGSSLANSNGLHHKRSLETYDFSVGNVRHDPGSGKSLLDVSYPVAEQPGVVRGVVSAALDFSWINHSAVHGHLYPGVTFTLVSSLGTVLLRYPNGSDWIGKSIFSAAEQSVASRDTETSFEARGLDGVHRLFAFSRLKNPVGGQTVYVAIDLPTTVAFANTKKILIENLFALAIVSAIILSLAWFGTDVIVLRRIRDIIAATNKVADGNLSARTTMAYDNSELGQMARAFDNLAYALEKRAAEAIDSAKQIHHHRQQQEALYDLNRGITSTLDVANVLKTLLDHISTLFPAYQVTVSWIDTRTNNLESIAHQGVNGPEQSHEELVSAQFLPRLVLARESPIAIQNARIDPRTANHEFFLRNQWTSYVGLPLIAKQELLGVLSFYGREEREFSQEEMDFLNALVNEAAIAIYNSRLYEQTREQTIELEKSNKIKDEFLGVMSHELRTPLNIIMNYSEALKMGTFGEINRDQERGTEKIRAQASHLLSLINGILEITKIESGTATVVADQFDLTEFMSESKSDYMMPMEKDLLLEWNYPADLPVIASDRVKLKQILMNLVTNAIKFTEHGSVKILARVLSDGPIFELQVADTGPGIPDDLLPFVFEKFRQIDSATTRNYSGAGLGLYIVKNFVDLLGGNIEARSKVGEGSVFTVRLPIHREPTPTISVHSPARATTVAHTI